MAALTDAAPPSRRQQNNFWESDAWSCPDPQRCVRCDCAVTSPSTTGAGVVNFVLDNQAADCEDEDREGSLEEDSERWFLVGCKRPYQYEPLVQGDVDFEENDEGKEEEEEEDELAVLLLEQKSTLLVPVDEDERKQHQVKTTAETKKKKKKKSDSSSSDDSSSSSSSSSSSDSDDSSSSSNTSGSSDSSSGSSSSSEDSSSSSSDSSDSSTSSDSSSSDSSGDYSKKRKKKKRNFSNSNSKEKDASRKVGNINQNRNPAIRNAHEVGAASHAPVGPTAEGSTCSEDDVDDEESCKDLPPVSSVLSTVVKVPQTAALHSNIDDGVMKAHIDSSEHKNSNTTSKKHHHKQNR